jgi:RNA polymerase sigma-70 factor (ECF subfamily)
MNDWEVQQLLKRLAAGDLTAFDRIYEMTFQDVYRTLSLLVVNRADIEDVMNEVYVGMWLSLPRYDPNRPFRYWLHGLIVRKAHFSAGSASKSMYPLPFPYS